MKKSCSIILSLFIIISLCICVHAQNKEKIIPKCTTAPVIDGSGGDAGWNNKLSFSISLQNAEYSLNKNDNDTDCTVDMVWSDQSNKEGLYFKISTSDATQSFAEDTNDIDLMDHFRLVIDPLYKRQKTADNCALDFIFAPYTANKKQAAWNVLVSEENPSFKFIKAASSIVTQKDPFSEKDVICGYTMEIFIPVSALKIGNYEPTFKPGTKLGLGLAIADYEYNAQANENILLNLLADFGQGQDSFNIPQKYNTYILADENGSTVPPEDHSTNGDNPTENTGEEMFTLRKSLTTANNVLNNENTSAYYTESSLSALKSAVSTAQKITASNTITEIKQARQTIDNAYAALETKESLRDLLSRASLLQKEDYTPDSWEAFSQAKSAAANFDEKENSERGRNVKIALIEAISNLTPATSKSPQQAKEDLSEIVLQANTLKKSDYTQESWTRFAKMLKAAEDLLLSSSDISAAQYDSAAKALSEAQNELIKASGSIWPLIIILICAIIVISGVITLIVYIRKSRNENNIEPEPESEE